jgi:RNA polymerase sigma-70 factor (ECF subfamily)
MTPADVARAAETAARTSYGRLLALLASRSRDIAAAEDALAQALAAALASWPARGVPANPDAWLFTAARRAMRAARARSRTVDAGAATMAMIDAERAERADIPFGDERLKLLFVCAHPAIAADAQAPLMLQAVLGLDAARIAASFVATPGAMGQKLVRAKRRIRDAGIAFAIPDADAVPARLAAVRAAIYAAYATGWDDAYGARPSGLNAEAIFLARLLVDLVPDDPEGLGLLALMLYCEARRPARRDAAGDFVPLAAQDPKRWDRAMQREAEALMRAAARFATPGRFQLEAAIQSLHAETVMTGKAHPGALVALYDTLVAVAPSLGAQVARASATAEAGNPAQALDLLDQLAGRAAAYQPWWAARARTLHRLGDHEGAHAAAAQAAAMTSDEAVRRWLLSGALFNA